MKEHLLLLKSEMVRAVLEGRKTQTRCPLKPQPQRRIFKITSLLTGKEIHYTDGYGNVWKCPWQIGDRLWVRETWAGEKGDIVYRADCSLDFKPADSDKNGFDWRPSIHMPRWASRITLEITRIGAERIQEISEEDAKAEGIKGIPTAMGILFKPAFSRFWDSLYAKKDYGWKENPGVWVREFRRING